MVALRAVRLVAHLVLIMAGQRVVKMAVYLVVLIIVQRAGRWDCSRAGRKGAK